MTDEKHPEVIAFTAKPEIIAKTDRLAAEQGLTRASYARMALFRAIQATEAADGNH